MNGKIARNIERPRPLRSNSKTDSGPKEDSSGGDVEGVHQLLLNVSSKLDRADFGGSLPEAIAVLNKALKVHGAKLENAFGSGLNQHMGILMTSVKDARLDMASKLYLLEIIELRKNKWVTDSGIAEYYKQKLALLEPSGLKRSASLNASAPEFAPSASSTPLGPTLRQSMSVDAGAGDTPRKESPMMIKVGGETIRIACNNEEMAKTCKRALDMYFAEKSGESSSNSGKSGGGEDSVAENAPGSSATSSAKSLIAYDRGKLLELASAPPSLKAHVSVVLAYADFPMLKRRPDSEFKLPYNWSETFNDEATSGAVLACGEDANNNYNPKYPHAHAAATSAVSGLKKNFLDVLRPNAPRRVWDNNIGEWVEADTRG